ncbi:hypothetical protein DLH72_00815 [Candidatus Gracilibacteria bacterium]|nr:MAG: hypothetical protein DLH72_00815 [Candidatus Gracilibacteria bacterium]
MSALLSFFYLGFLGLLGCLFLFFSIFTAGNLWSMMNVTINQDLKISLLFFVFGILLLGLGAYFKILKGGKQFNKFLLSQEGQRENQQGQKIEIELQKVDGELQKSNQEFKIEEKNLKNNTQKSEKSQNISQVSFGDLLIILKNFLKNILVFFIGIFVSLLPWFIKNTIYIYPNFSISGLLKGKDEGFKPDLKNIFSGEEIKIKNEIKQEQRKKEVVTQNEDLKRYLGYESGILPYTNMFWNISMQVNQGGKFTEISFLFFALIPLIFIFLPFKNKYFPIFIIIFVFFQLVFLSNPSVTVHKNYPLDNISKYSIEKIFSKTRSGDYVFVYKDIKKLENSLEKNAQKQEILQIWKQNRTYLQNLRDILASISLPFGYFVVFLFFMILLFAIHYFLKKDEKNFIFRLNLVFSTIYIFFWCISSFSIVWYGITMYFCLLFMIGFCGQIISKQTKNSENQRFYGSLVFMIIILSFLIFTSIPHSTFGSSISIFCHCGFSLCHSCESRNLLNCFPPFKILK